jgi:hypothetical protein
MYPTDAIADCEMRLTALRKRWDEVRACPASPQRDTLLKIAADALTSLERELAARKLEGQQETAGFIRGRIARVVGSGAVLACFTGTGKMHSLHQQDRE